MAVHPLSPQPINPQAARTAVRAVREAEAHRTMGLVRLLVLVAGALFLTALGASVAVSLTQPFARAVVVAALALPVAALLGLIARSWTLLRH